MNAKQKLDASIAQLWGRRASGIQVNVLDIPRIFADVRDAFNQGIPLEEAIDAAAVKYGRKP
jgi:hypothetical protein